MSFFTILSVASSIGQAFMSYQQAAAMRAYYDAQADISKLQYQAKRAEAKEQGVQALKATNKAIASIVAKGAAGGILTNEGSVLLGQTISLGEGARDFRTAQLNEQILGSMGALEFRNLKEAGQIQQQTGILGALTGFGTSLTETYQAGLFDDVNIKMPTFTKRTTTNG